MNRYRAEGPPAYLFWGIFHIKMNDFALLFADECYGLPFFGELVLLAQERHCGPMNVPVLFYYKLITH